MFVRKTVFTWCQYLVDIFSHFNQFKVTFSKRYIKEGAVNHVV